MILWQIRIAQVSHILVYKALWNVLHEEYNTRGSWDKQIQHKRKSGAVIVWGALRVLHNAIIDELISEDNFHFAASYTSTDIFINDDLVCLLEMYQQVN